MNTAHPLYLIIGLLLAAAGLRAAFHLDTHLIRRIHGTAAGVPRLMHHSTSRDLALVTSLGGVLLFIAGL